MFSAKQYPTYLPSGALDAYLERGWFRMNQALFITHFLHFQNQFFPAVWLRYPLNNGIAAYIDKKLQPIHQRFQIRIKRWEYCSGQEELYSMYRAQSGIDLTTTFHELLMGQEESNVFNTMQVEILDSLRLIALGIFDLGANSSAGISNIYHPDYRKYSLGKALIYAKMHYSRQQGMDLFYPGYAVPGQSRFNYKLDIAPDHTEYFCPLSLQWLPYLPSVGLPNLLNEMERNLTLLLENLLAFGINCALMYYRHFDADLMGLDFTDLLPYPIFLLLGFDSQKSQWMIGVYDLVTGKYSVLICHTLLTLTNNTLREKLICADILQVSESIASGLDLEGIIQLLNVE